MQVQLDSLIERIRQEGIQEADKRSQEIIKQAQDKGQTLIKQAEERAESIIKAADDKAARLKENSNKAVEQAVRDATLSLKQEIRNLFDAVLKKQIQHSLSDDFIKKLIVKIIEDWPKDKKRETGFEISLSQQDKQKLEGLILEQLKAELSAGASFKVSPDIDKGFYISRQGEDFYYDFSDQAILEILRQYLRPFIVEILDKQESK